MDPEHTASRNADGGLISEQDVEFWKQNGFLHIPSVFTPEEMDDLERDFEWLVSDWTEAGPGWQGPWRKVLMDEKTEEAPQTKDSGDALFPPGNQGIKQLLLGHIGKQFHCC